MGAHQVTPRAAGVVLAIVMAVGLVGVPAATAVPVVDDGPFVIAATPGSFPVKARVAHNPDRDEYVVAYEASGSQRGINAVRVDGNGQAVGAPIALSTWTTSQPLGNSQAVNVVHNPANGEYFVLWSEHAPGIRYGIVRAQRLSAAGAQIGGPITVTPAMGDTPSCGYASTDVAFNPATGGYVAIARLWYASTTPGADCGGLEPGTSRYEVRSLTTSGSVSSMELIPGGRASGHGLASLGHNPATGEFMAVWQQIATGGDVDTSATRAHRLTSSGEPVGSLITLPAARSGGSIGYAAGDPDTGNWMLIAHRGGAGNLAHLLSPAGAPDGEPVAFGRGNDAYDLVATGDGRWIASDVSGTVTELDPTGQPAGQTAGLPSASIALALIDGSDPVRALATWGQTSTSSIGGAFVELTPERPVLEPGVRRVSGEGRVQTAVSISAATFEPGVDVAYVATAGGFPDALGAGPLAATQRSPILLTGTDSLDPATRTELERLGPERIVVLGGSNAVGPAVAADLQSLTRGTVTRLSGTDRFDTAALVAAQFDPGQDHVLVATGLSFPDALAGGAAAAISGSPIVLVLPDAIPESSRRALERLAPDRITVLGGTSAVSDSVLAELGTIAANGAQRLAGADRFDTAARISGLFDAPVDTVVIATGANFPDALAGTPAAALRNAPILLVTDTTIPPPISAALDRLAPREIIILGGPGAVSDAVASQLSSHIRN